MQANKWSKLNNENIQSQVFHFPSFIQAAKQWIYFPSIPRLSSTKQVKEHGNESTRSY